MSSIKPYLVVISATLALVPGLFAQGETDNKRAARELFINGTTLQLQGNRHAEAILEFQEAIRLDSSAATLTAMARSYLELRKFDRAEEHVRASLKSNPESRDSWELLAEILVASGSYDEGVEAYEHVRALGPSRRQLYTLGRLYEPRNALKAIEVFEELVKEYQDPAVYLRLAALYGRAKNPRGVVHSLERAQELAPTDPEIAEGLLDVYLSSGRLEEAIALAHAWNNERVGESRSRQVWGGLLRGLMSDSLLANLFDNQVRDVIDESIQRYPESFMVLSMSGSLALSIRDVDRANAAFFRAGNVVQERPDQLLQLGSVYTGSGYPQQGILFLQHWQPLHPKDVRFLILIADSYVVLDEDTKAIDYFRASLDLDPTITYSWANLGVLYDALNMTDSSDAAYGQVLLLEPLDVFVNNNFAYSLAVRGERLDDAKRMAWVALQQEPTNPAYLDTYAWVLFMSADYDEAAQYIEQAVKNGGNATHYEHWGDILEKIGDFDGAVRAWEFALEQDPSRTHLRSSIDRLR